MSALNDIFGNGIDIHVKSFEQIKLARSELTKLKDDLEAAQRERSIMINLFLEWWLRSDSEFIDSDSDALYFNQMMTIPELSIRINSLAAYPAPAFPRPTVTPDDGTTLARAGGDETEPIIDGDVGEN